MSTPALRPTRPTSVAAPPPAQELTLVDLLDRLLQGGIVLQGDVILAAADVDLVRLDLRILIASIEKAAGR